jgi:hypothetical protein
MFETPEQLQRLVNRAAQQQAQTDLITRAINAGDEHAAWFYSLPEQVQQDMLTKQDVQDVADAARVGDRDGVRRAVTSVVNRVVFQGAQLVKPPRREPLPRRRNRGGDFRV